MFNAAKNQGCHPEHSYDHGKQHISSELGGLLSLAFLIDQVQENFCRIFGEIRTYYKLRRILWERLRTTYPRPKHLTGKGSCAFGADRATLLSRSLPNDRHTSLFSPDQ